MAGKRIPIESRIVFCCDAFNAMTTDRPYRKAMSEEAAIEELRANAGTQFDPTVVEALLAVLAENPKKVPDKPTEKPLRVAEPERALDKSTIESSGASADT